MKSEAIIQTEKGVRYLKQLCKHFQHKVPADFDDQIGWVDLPMGRTDLRADATTLTLLAIADALEHLKQVEQVMQSHLERFAFRENLEVIWHPARSETPETAASQLVS